MADKLKLRVATPERLFVDEEVTEIEVPGANGYMGFLPGHAALLSALGPGLLSYSKGGGRESVFVDGGFVEVFRDEVRVLADAASSPNEIQADAARKDLEAANEALKNAKDADESERALCSYFSAEAKIEASGSSQS